ncbi:MAG: oligosaccharide flippase family protein [Clostridiales bacterium]|nr:oligosaccharide flippase family protein [Clostridiales bacterium]
MPPKRNFVKIGLVYSAGQILLQSLSVLLLPLYTRYLSVAQYGRLSIFTTISEVTGLFLVLGIYTGYYRFYNDYSPDMRQKLRNTVFTFSAIIGPSAALIMIGVSMLAEPLKDSVEDFRTVFVLIVLNNLFIQTCTIFECDYYLEYRARKIVPINLIKSAASVALIAYFLIIRSGGIVGIFAGQTIANLVLLLYFIIINLRKLRLELDRGMLSKMLKFSIGLMPGNLSAAALNFSDRFFMAGYRTLRETGVYSVGYKIGMQIDPLFCTPFRQVFTTYKYENWRSDRARNLFDDAFTRYHILGCFFILCLSVFSRPLICVFADRQYLTAYTTVPLIALAVFLFAETRFFNLGIEMENKTYLDSAILTAGGVLNIGLNFIFIPGLGIFGAALSTVVSYLFILVFYAVISGRLMRIGYSLKKPLIVLVITAALYGCYYAYSRIVYAVLTDLIPCVILPAAFILLCVATGVVTPEEIRELSGSLSAMLRRKRERI